MNPAADPDPVSRATDLFWDEWSFLLLRSAFLGVRRFEAFLDSAPISRNRLAERLQRLIDGGLLTKQPGERHAEYRLTPAAQALYPVIVLLLRWAHQQLGLAKPSLNLLHAGTHALDPVVLCRHCERPLMIGDVRFERRPDASLLTAEAAPERGPKRRRFRQLGGDGASPAFDPELAFALEAVGDRWSVLVLRSAFFGLKRFDEIQADLGIARNILADRLQRLQAHGLLASRPYCERPLRHEYLLTDRSRAMYPAIMLMRAWSLQWISQPPDAWLLQHEPCGQPLEVEARCAGCGGVPDARQVQVEPTHVGL